MPKGIMIVESRPASADEAEAYNRWYDEVHVPELLAVDGFRAARRLRAADGDSYLAVYEVDDVDAAQAALAEARATGTMTKPTAIRLDPPPSVKWFCEMG